MALWHTPTQTPPPPSSTPEISNLWPKVKLGLTWSTCDQAILLPLCLEEEKKKSWSQV